MKTMVGKRAVKRGEDTVNLHGAVLCMIEVAVTPWVHIKDCEIVNTWRGALPTGHSSLCEVLLP